MSMQLFSFGHPCEHQLHRACIGGSNCPLNGYPDTWCCSFIKGKINFKRDRPCEGPRCHWDFVHPTQSQFDEVTQVLEQSRPIAAKLDEAKDTDLLSFQINNPHVIDTVQCALHMMRHPPSTCARRVGQLLAYAAVLAGDQDVFVQLLKTMKKPVDGYILGAYAYLTQSKSGAGGGGGGRDKGSANSKGHNKKQSKKKDSKDDISGTLANIMVELMNAALSLGGQLVDREDQHVLQAMLIKALSTYPKSDKRHQEMLERAIAKFGNRKLDEEEEAAAKLESARREAAAAAAATTTPIPKDLANTAGPPTPSFTGAANNAGGAEGGEASGASAVAEEDATATAPVTSAAPVGVPLAAPSAVNATTVAIAAGTVPFGNLTGSTAATTTMTALTVAVATEPANSATGAPVTIPTLPPAEVEAKVRPPSMPPQQRVVATGRRTPPDEAPAGATSSLGTASTPKTNYSAPGTPSAAVAVVAPVNNNNNIFNATPIFSTAANISPSAQQALMRTAPSATNLGGVAAVATTATATTPMLSAGAPPAAASPSTQAAAAVPPAGPIVGISSILTTLRDHPRWHDQPLLWSTPDPVGPMPALYLCGGQFSVRSSLWGVTPLGDAAREPLMDLATQSLANYVASLREKVATTTAEATSRPPPEPPLQREDRFGSFCSDSDDFLFVSDGDGFESSDGYWSD